MFILLKKDEVIGVSDYKELLEATIQDGEKIVSEEDYIKSFTLEDTINQPLKDDSTSDNTPSTSSSNNDNDDSSDIKLDAIYVLEAITDLQTQLEELQEVPHEESSTEEIKTLAN